MADEHIKEGCVQDKKMIDEKKPGFFLRSGDRPVWKKAGFLARSQFFVLYTERKGMNWTFQETKFFQKTWFLLNRYSILNVLNRMPCRTISAP